ncbi:hypothetical protein [Luteimonas sp. MC1572]|uniref:hypothetical protein n=1 Tax=Luteimonas sp. MC1572 TaxID=2799325 RepID=UPI0018F0F6BF|nr:hypothetical protein [Luteimonas sp. MC1572]MBJ6981681.1 hypothetical protein [Luteimonas sp. MC1572]QQO02973.1 hypothetical protein JGR64_12560 [Luteimonas sp. MC1572]
MRSLLQGSFFYPGAHDDLTTVRMVSGQFRSSVLVDYALTAMEAESMLRSMEGFSVQRLDRWPDAVIAHLGLGEKPWPPGSDWMDEKPWNSFVLWALLQSDEDEADLRSVLYVGGDAIAAFDALYTRHSVAPGAVAVLQYGMGWTDFQDGSALLANAVLGNPVGRPALLLTGGAGLVSENHYKTPGWPGYSGPLAYGSTDRHDVVAVWGATEDVAKSHRMAGT